MLDPLYLQPGRSFYLDILNLYPYVPLELSNEVEIMNYVQAMYSASLKPRRPSKRISPVRSVFQPEVVEGRALLLLERLYGALPDELSTKLASSISIRLGFPFSHADWLVLTNFVSTCRTEEHERDDYEQDDALTV